MHGSKVNLTSKAAPQTDTPSIIHSIILVVIVFQIETKTTTRIMELRGKMKRIKESYILIEWQTFTKITN
jgi:hypothetical protein